MKRILHIVLVLVLTFACGNDGYCQIINTIAGNGVDTCLGDGGYAVSASFHGAGQSYVDKYGRIFVLEYNRIRKIDTNGIITTIAGNGTVGNTGDGGPATAALLSDINCITGDTFGNLYVGINGTSNSRIRKINSAGMISTFAGTGLYGYTGDGGPATLAKISVGQTMVTDPNGNLYFPAETGTIDGCVRRVNTSGIITTIAGFSSGGITYTGDGGPATAASIGQVTGMAFDLWGNLYITETYSHSRKIDTFGIITSAGYIGNWRITIDTVGNLYYIYIGYIRKLNLLGGVSNYAGNGTYIYSGDGGPATAAGLSAGVDITSDIFGNFYITGENRIRKISFYNSTPYFTAGAYVRDTVCANSIDSMNILLAVADSDNGQALIWSAVTAPAHGTAHLVDSMSTTGLTMTPRGMYYAPNAGYTGNDTFRVRVWDGYKSDTIAIYLTVTPGAAAIAGATHVCTGYSTTLTDASPVGVWSSSNTIVAAVGSLTGVVSGVAAGAAIITYTATLACGISVATKAFTTDPTPPVPTVLGAPAICGGSTTSVYASVPGVWSSGATGIATVGSSTGTVTGVAAGVATISTTNTAGCSAWVTVTVLPTPTAISGTLGACTGTTTTLSNSISGGVWSSAGTSVATIGSLTGIVNGISAGTSVISYTLVSGCGVGAVVTVNPTPTAVTGSPGVCPGSLTILYNGTGGGIWYSRNPLIATADSALGVVTGVAAGSTQVIYSMGAGCSDSMLVTVYPPPAAIVGSAILCTGLTTTLTDATSGGVWSSSNTGVATVGTLTGLVTAGSPGNTVISYTAASGCAANFNMTVTPVPAPITGTAAVCAGNTATLTETVTGGTWSSSLPGVSSINTSGTYRGVTAGAATMTYTLGPGCFATYPITVNPTPPGITGTLRVCVGGSSTLLNSTPGGTWSSSNTAIAYIGSTTGLAVGGVLGTATITYTLPTGCFTTALFTVNPNPGSISGSGTVCRNGSALLTISSTGGTWSSNNTAIATIGSSSGSMVGVAAGNTTISYTLPTGCYSIKNVTVNPLPSVITGPSTVCTGASITLRDSITGGSWSRSNTNVSVGITTGAVTGLAAGTSVVTYTLSTGCYATKIVTVTGTAGTISGTNHLCVGGSAVLTITPSGSGTWSSSNTAVATIGSGTGSVNAIAPGNTNITFTSTSGCSSVMAFTVNPLPTVFTVTGGGAYCAGGAGLHVGLSGSVTGASYQLFASGIAIGATVAGTGGVLDFGLQTAAGTYTITATTAAGCTTTMTGSAVIVINPLPSTISGASAVCAGSSATLSSSPAGGSWSSGTTTTGTIGALSGVFGGIAIGTTIITYTLPTGCYTTRTETVSTAPTAIVGASSVCNGASITLTDGVTGGLWYASGAASVGSTTGIVTGTAVGTAIVTYSLGTGCTVTKSITVNPSPAAITGTLSLCAGRTTTLSDATSGGTWGGGTTGVATIGTGTGLVTATGAGTTTVSYTVSGCAATAVVTVNAVPVDVSTITTLCVGSTATLAMTPAGGVWSSTATNVSVNSTSGAVTGIATGAAIITYTSGTCQSTRTISVVSTPVISGVSGLCVGSSATLTSGSTGGSWTSSNTAIVTIATTSGAMTGMAAGNATITYTAGGCTAIRNVTVSAGPAPITGASSVCVGSSTTLTTTTGGGTWTSSNTSIARVGSLTGTVTGVAAGSVNITYSLGSGCVVTWPMTVNATPGAITGTMSVCISGTSVLTSSGGSGVWSSSNTGIATIGSSTGLFTGVAAGTAAISYTIGTLPGCSATAAVTVNTPPSAITGPSAVCMGSSVALTSASTGGTWSSSNTIIATVGSLTGVVTGVNTGFAVITYSLGAGCIATKIVTVNLPPPGISGASRVCVGSSTTLTDPASGGVWRSSNTGIASAGSLSGVVSGVSGGVVTISYQVSEGCVATYPVTVNSVPPFTGLRSLCAWGDTVTIHDADGTGIYSSTLVTVANLGAGNARVTSSVPGSGTITYTLPTGCTATAPVTVNPLPGAITGSYSICVGSATTLTSSPGGGNWSCGATTIATVGSISGLTSGLSAGSARITYSLPTGCKTDTAIRVNPIPAGITGWGSVITVSTSSTYADATPGGIWTSSNPSIATIGMTTGTVYGVAPGVVTISYTVGTSCAATRVLRVQVLPGTGR